MGTHHPAPERGRSSALLPPPIFGPCLLWPNGWMDQDDTWHGGRPQPCNFVLDGDPAPSPKRAEPPSPIFGTCLLGTYGCMDQDATWFGGRPRPTRHCVRRGPSSPSSKGTQPPPNFLPISVLAKQLYGLRCHLVLG